jgi:hypothetical protein
MADKLLSQSDVDALVSSLTSNREVKKAPPAAAPVKAVNTSSIAVSPAKPSGASSNGLTSVRTASPAVVKAPVTQNASSRPAIPARQEPRPQPGAGIEKIGAIEAKLNDLYKKLDQLNALTNRIDLLEKKIVAVEEGLIRERENTAVNKQIQTLAEELKRISVNLQNTPGYGIRRQFKCEKCDDQGFVATMFRCTRCGHESWRGWWPQK